MGITREVYAVWLAPATQKYEFITKETHAVQQQCAAPGFRDARFAEAAQAVATVIANIDADVVALQELRNQTDTNELVAAIKALPIGNSNTQIAQPCQYQQLDELVAMDLTDGCRGVGIGGG